MNTDQPGSGAMPAAHSDSGIGSTSDSAISTSVSDDRLATASPHFLRMVRSGHAWVLNSVLVLVVLSSVLLLLPMVGENAEVDISLYYLGAFVLMLGTLLWMVLGLLRLTTPDPTSSQPPRPAAAARVASGLALTVFLLALIQSILMYAIKPTSSHEASTIEVTIVALSFVSYLVWAGMYIAMMFYMAWLGARVPDPWIVRRTRMYRWLLPVLATVGMLAVGLGGLVALVLYWNLLDRMRKHLKSIQATGAPAALKGVVA